MSKPFYLKKDSNLLARAKRVLEQNAQVNYTVPSKGLYPHQVLWDSCFIAIGLSHYDIERAKSEVKRLLTAQWKNGMIPHIVFTDGPRYWWDSRIWRSRINSLAPNEIATSGVSQPPMVAEAVFRIGQKLATQERIEWYESVFQQLVDYHLWLYRERDPLNEGIVVQLHPWETGLDNSPPDMVELRNKNLPWWLKLLEVSHLDIVGDYLRIDSKYVARGERSSNIEALSLYGLLRKIRHFRYNSELILEDPVFAIADITYNSIFSRANNILIEIARVIDQSLPEELNDYINKTHESFEMLWDNEHSAYYSRQFPSARPIRELSIGSLLPLYSGIISRERAAQLVKTLEDKLLFGLDYPIPTVPYNSPWFSHKRYWQGPTWVNTNWLIIDGLKRYGYTKQAELLASKTLELVDKSGFYEYFDPISGAPHGVKYFSWTAALTIDLLENIS